MTCGYCGEKITLDEQYWDEFETCEVCNDTFHHFYTSTSTIKSNFKEAEESCFMSHLEGNYIHDYSEKDAAECNHMKRG